MQKIRVGILFGGNSREREISFAGGRTVYDNLDKTLFETVPVFIDSFGMPCMLQWELVYKGSIRDFYPPVSALPPASPFQYYAEWLGLPAGEQHNLLRQIGKPLNWPDLKGLIDVAFLCLHGPNGEDGRLQGLLEYIGIPYTGSGILGSAIGIDKAHQKRFIEAAGFNSPKWLTIRRHQWSNPTHAHWFKKCTDTIGFPLVVKAATQGSSIGVSIVQSGHVAFAEAVNKAFFMRSWSRAQWSASTTEERTEWVRTLCDIREGIGLPVWSETLGEVHTPDELLHKLNAIGDDAPDELLLEAADAEAMVLVEGFVEGREFSCIVVQNDDDDLTPIALPPTEIRKGKELFDYRSKYLPGLSRKVTPIDLPDEHIQSIRKACTRLFGALGFEVYARIDGFIGSEGQVFLNDPNTTSGMMPSSFFFHQAAEIGLNPSQFLTYILRLSLRNRNAVNNLRAVSLELLKRLDDLMAKARTAASKKPVAVLLGGYSSERHISVESGRNIYEKLSSSESYAPIPVFLSGKDGQHKLHVLPINLLLKDNADDILEKINVYKVHPVVEAIRKECALLTGSYSSAQSLQTPRSITYEELAREVSGVFIALHGRPGEDGAVQTQLQHVGLPYNGSLPSSAALTINKFETNERLMKAGFHCAAHTKVGKPDWQQDPHGTLAHLESSFRYPFIAKPVDDGCSSAVRKIKSAEDLRAFATLIFRSEETLDAAAARKLNVKPNEEFPAKDEFLVEALIGPEDADHFLEITIGLLTRFNAKGELEYEVFEASEALSEGEVLSLEEKFLAGQGQNITPARYAANPQERQRISDLVKVEVEKAARLLDVQGYARIDAFVRVYKNKPPVVLFIEVNSLPGMTPATCIFHQTAIQGYTPFQFIDRILKFGEHRLAKT